MKRQKPKSPTKAKPPTKRRKARGGKRKAAPAPRPSAKQPRDSHGRFLPTIARPIGAADPEKLIKLVAGDLGQEGFEIADYSVHISYAQPISITSKSGKPKKVTWHNFEIYFDDNYPIEPELIEAAFLSFRDRLQKYYHMETSLRVLTGIETNAGTTAERWAVISATQRFTGEQTSFGYQGGVFESIKGNIARWLLGPTGYVSFNAISVMVRAPARR